MPPSLVFQSSFLSSARHSCTFSSHWTWRLVPQHEGSSSTPLSSEVLEAALDAVLGCGAEVSVDYLKGIEHDLRPTCDILYRRLTADELKVSNLRVRGFEPWSHKNESLVGVASVLNHKVPSFPQTKVSSWKTPRLSRQRWSGSSSMTSRLLNWPTGLWVSPLNSTSEWMSLWTDDGELLSSYTSLHSLCSGLSHLRIRIQWRIFGGSCDWTTKGVRVP